MILRCDPDPEGRPTPEAARQMLVEGRRSLTIGLPASISADERRFPLTPEAAGMLVDSGYRVRLQEGAAAPIHYTDAQYTRAGAEVASRSEVLACDIVISASHPAVADVAAMRRGAWLITFLKAAELDGALVRALLRQGVTAIALDLIGDGRGNTPFADILCEIEGRAALAVASSILADPIGGKGILLGGVAGIVPCEVLILGSGNSAVGAARSASGLGAVVRMMDNDVYRLRAACRQLEGCGVIASALHPRGIESAVRTADVVVVTPFSSPLRFDSDEVELMKRGVLTFDLTQEPGRVFPSMPMVSLADAITRRQRQCAAQPPQRRVCFVNAGSAVPRTAAMALSNTFITLFDQMALCRTPVAALKLMPGLQQAALTFAGRAVNRLAAERAGVRPSNISFFLALS